MIITKTNTKILDSYKYKNNELPGLVDRIITERKRRKYPITRSKQSYINEIKAHNRLYKLGIARSHTKDCDLDENPKKRMEILYKIFGR